eukprot:TRINITY_DN5888_c0_g1_i1.p1 TRINITY_DN5888_c0_g1~~TRINITY_DN5888_c0_g1_i1.p1  ORF type:complete len:5059 (-),score=1335.09 TRINITY_DN5888_c0_g1_i1:98-15274(-)
MSKIPRPVDRAPSMRRTTSRAGAAQSSEISDEASVSGIPRPGIRRQGATATATGAPKPPIASNVTTLLRRPSVVTPTGTTGAPTTTQPFPSTGSTASGTPSSTDAGRTTPRTQFSISQPDALPTGRERRISVTASSAAVTDSSAPLPSPGGVRRKEVASPGIVRRDPASLPSTPEPTSARAKPSPQPVRQPDPKALDYLELERRGQIRARQEMILDLGKTDKSQPRTDAAKSLAEGQGLEISKPNVPARFVVSARDTQGKPRRVGGDPVTVVISGPARPQAVVTDNRDGTYGVSYVPTITGNYQIYVAIKNFTIAGSPFAMKCSLPRLDAQRCVASGSGLAVAYLNRPSTFVIQARDQFDEPIKEEGIQFHVEIAIGDEEVPCQVEDIGGGEYRVSYSPHQMGECVVSVALGDLSISGSPFYGTVGTDSLDPSRSTASGDGLYNAIAGESTSFIVEARDQFGAVRTHGGDRCEVKASGDVQLQTVDNDDGTYTVTYQSNRAGTFHLSITLDDEEIESNPFAVRVLASTACAEMTHALGDGIRVAKVGKPTSFVIHPADRFGNVLTISESLPFTCNLVSGDEQITGSVVSNLDGTYSASYELACAGQYALSVALDGVPISGSPFTVFAQAGNPNAKKCTKSFDGVLHAVAGETTTFTVQARDQFGNICGWGGHPFEITASSVAEVKIVDNDDGQGTSTCYYTPSVIGRHIITVALDDLPVGGAPFGVVVVAGKVHAAACTASGDGLTQAIAGTPAMFTIQTKDRCDNKRSEGDDVPFVVRVEGPESAVGEIVNHNNGSFGASYSVKKAGSYKIHVSLNDVPIHGSPFSCSVSAAATAASVCTAYGSGLDAPTAGAAESFVIVGRDIYGNQRANGGDPFDVQLKGPLSVRGLVEDVSNGTYTVQYKITQGGKYAIYVRLHGEQIVGSPFYVDVKPSETDAGNCVLNHARGTTFSVADGYNFEIIANDSYGNRRNTGGDAFEVALRAEDGKSILEDVIKDNGDGSYLASIPVQRAGLHVVSVSMGGRLVKGAPFSIVGLPGSADSAQSVCYGWRDFVAGESCSARIQGRDKFGNQCIGSAAKVGAAIRAEPSGASEATIYVDDVGDGSYSLLYNSKTAGKLCIEVNVDGVALRGSPFFVEAQAGAAFAPSCVLSGAALKDARAGQDSVVSLQLRDRFNNVIRKGGERVRAELRSAASIVPASVEDNGDGTYAVRFSAQQAGKYTLHATVADAQVSATGAAIQVLPGDTHASHCALTNVTTSVASGVSNAFEIIAHDVFGNLVRSGGDKFDVGVVGPSESDVTVADSVEGRYRVSFVPRLVGTYHVTARKDGISVAGCPLNIQCLPGATVAKSCVAQTPATQVTAGSVATFPIVAKDLSGNARSEGGDVFEVTYAGPKSGRGLVNDHGTGSYTAEFSTTVAGDYQISVRLGGEHVQGSPFACIVSAPTFGPRSVADGDNLSSVVAGQTGSFVVHVRDRFGVARTVGGDQVTVKLVPTVGASIGGAVSDLGDGSYRIDYTATQAGTYDLHVRVNGDAIAGSPFNLVVRPDVANASNSFATIPCPLQLVAGHSLAFAVHAIDSFGNAVATGNAKLEVFLTDGTEKIACEWNDNHNGLYDATLLSNKAGDFAAHVLMDGQHVRSSPFALSCLAGSTQPTECVVQAVDAERCCAGEVLVLLVQTRDRFGNRRTVGGDDVRATVTQSGLSVAAAVSDAGDGSYRVKVSPLQSGALRVQVSVNSTDVGKTVQVDVIAAATDPARCIVLGSVPPMSRAGSQFDLQLIACDRFGNRRETGGDRVELATSGAKVDVAAAVDNGDGSYRLQFTTLQSSDSTVVPVVNGLPVVASTFAFTTQPSVVSARNCLATLGPQDGSFIVGTEGCIHLKSFDRFDNALTTGGANVDVQIVGAAGASARVEDQGNGSYTLWYTARRAGKYDVQVSVNGDAANGSPFHVNAFVGKISAANSLISGDALQGVRAGEQVTLLVEARDRFGNVVAVGGERVRAILRSPVVVEAAVVDRSNGTYAVSFACSSVGVFTLDATIHGEPVGDGQCPIKVSPAAPHGNATRLTRLPTEPVPAGATTSFAFVSCDQFGNRVRQGGAAFRAALKGDVDVPCTIEDNADGSYVAKCVAQRAGTYHPVVELAGVKSAEKTTPVVIVPAAISPEHSFVVQRSEHMSIGDHALFTVHARDCFDNVITIGGDRFETKVDGPSIPPITLNDLGNGAYNLAFVARVGGDYHLSVLCNDRPLKNMPITVPFAAHTNSSRCTASGPGLVETLAGERATFQVQARDKFNGLRSVGGDVVTIQLIPATDAESEAADAAVESAVTDNGDGTYDVSYILTQAGVYDLQVRVNGGVISSSPWLIQVKHNKLHPPNCVVTNVSDVFEAGVAQEMELHTKDAFGNALVVVPAIIKAQLVGPDTIDVKLADVGDGKFTGRFEGRIAGSYMLHITAADVHVCGSPFPLEVQPAATYPHNCVLGAPRSTVAGEPIRLTVSTRDLFNNDRHLGDDQVQCVAVSPGQQTVDVVVTDNENGVYTLELRPTIAPVCVLDIVVNGSPIASSPFSLVVTPASLDVTRSNAEGTGLARATAGEEASFVVWAVDQYGNKLLEGNDLLSVVISGEVHITPAVQDNQDGSYTYTYTPTVAGKYEISIGDGVASVVNSPFDMEVFPAAAFAGRCIAAGDALSSAIAGIPAEFTVQLHDRFGNALPENTAPCTAALEWKGEGTATLRDIVVQSVGNGSFACRYTATKAGPWMLQVNVNGQPISGSPFPVVLRPGEISLERCCIIGRPETTVTAGTQYTLPFATCDAFGNPTTFGFESDTLGVAVESSQPVDIALESQGNGRHTLTMVPTGVGKHDLSITFGDDDTLPYCSVTVTCVPAKVVASQSAVIGDEPSDFIAGNEVQFMLQARDEFGNDRTVGGDAFEVDVTGPEGGVARIEDNGNGTYTIRYGGRRVGEYVINVRCGGEHIISSPFKAVCSPGPAHASCSILAGRGLSEARAGEKSLFTITACDRYGNSLSTGNDLFIVNMTGAAVVPTGIHDNGDGTYNVEYTGTAAGEHSLSVMLHDLPVPGSPFKIVVRPAAVNAAACVVDGDGLTRAVAGSEATFTVTARDVYQNARGVGGDTFACNLFSSGADLVQVPVKVTDLRNGEYKFAYTATTAGVYALQLLLDLAPISSEARRVVVAPGPSFAARCVADGTGRKTARAGETSAFTIVAKDQFANRRQSGGDNFQVSLVGSSALVGAVQDNEDGSYLVQYTTRVAGRYSMHVSLEGIAIADSPFDVLVAATTESAPHCTHSALPQVCVAGKQQHLTITARDKFNNNVARGGTAVTASFQGPAPAKWKVDDRGDGTYDLAWTAYRRGQYSGNILVNDEPIGEPFSFGVVPGAGNANSSRAEGLGLTRATVGVRSSFTVLVADKYGNRLNHGGELVAANVSGGSEAHADVVDNGDGTYTISYLPYFAGQYSVHVSLNQEHVHGSPFVCEVATGALHPAKCRLAAAPQSHLQAGATTMFSVLACDEYGNRIVRGGARLQLLVAGADSVLPRITDDNSGTYKAELVLTKAGPTVVSLLLDDQHIAGSPFEVVVQPGGVNAAQSRVTCDPVLTCVAGNTVDFGIQTRDRFGNDVTESSQDVSVALTGPQKLMVAVVARSNGYYVAHCTPQHAGSYKAVVTLAGKPVQGSPLTLVTTAAAAYAQSCTVVGAGAQSFVAGDECSFIVQARDRFGNDRFVGADAFTVDVAGTEGGMGRVEDNRNGTYTIRYGGRRAGQYVIDVRCAGERIHESPFTVQSRAGRAQATSSLVTGEGLIGTRAGEEGQVKVCVRDRYGNAIKTTGDRVRAALTGPGADAVASVHDNENGVFVVSYKCSIAGKYRLLVDVNDTPVQGSPFEMTVEAGVVDAKKCVVSGEGLAHGVAGETSTFIVSGYDRFGNVCHTGGARVTCELRGTSTSVAQVVDYGNGTYEVKYIPTIAGRYTLDLRVGGAAVGDAASAAIDVVASTAEALHSVARGTGLSKATAGEQATFNITASDAFGNRVTTGGDHFDVSVVAEKVTIDARVTDNGDGTYTAFYALPYAGPAQLRISLAGKAIRDSPFSVQIAPSHTSGGRCIVTDITSLCPAGTTSSFNIIAHDQFGNKRPTGGDEFTVSLRSASAGSLQGDVTDNSNGSYSVNYTLTTAGQYELLVMLKGMPISAAVPVLVQPGPADANSCVVLGAGARDFVAGQEATFVVQTRDRFSNVRTVGGDAFAVVVSGASGASGRIDDNGDGTYIVRYRGQMAAKYKLDVVCNGVPLKGSPFECKAVAGPADPSSCMISAEQNLIVRAGEKQSFTVIARDKFTNPLFVGGEKFQVRSDSAFVQSEVTDGQDGTYEVSFWSNVAGRCQVFVSLQNVPIFGSPIDAYVVAAEPDPDCTTILGYQNSCMVGEQTGFVVCAKDKYGNRCTRCSAEVQVEVLGPQDVQCVTHDNENGTYFVAATANVAGLYTFNVTMNGQIVRGGGQLVVEMKAGPTDPSRCTAYGAALERGTVMDAAVPFTIEAHDAFGNAKQGGGDNFKVSFTGPAPIADVRLDDNMDGTYTGVFTAKAAGKYEMFVRLGDTLITGTPMPVQMTIYPNMKSFAFRVIEDRARRELVRYQELMRQAREEWVQLKEDAIELQQTMPGHIDNTFAQIMSVLQARQDIMNSVNSKYGFECNERKRLYNVIQELRGNIRVFCRARPFNAKELREREPATILLFPKPTQVVLSQDITARHGQGKERKFDFDRVFTPSASQEEVFEETKPVVTSVLDGYNVCIFAYGQTGSGKTHTMEGEPPFNPGVNYRALNELFRVIKGSRARDYRYSISISVLEIYNENIRDLLDDSASKKNLEVMHHAHGNWVPGLTIVGVTSPDQVFEIMKRGLLNRSIGVTNMNEHSSRSHCILSVYAEGHNLATGLKTYGKLHLVDLAGSERINKSGATGDRLVEAQHINKSLSALGNVISALVKRNTHVPYRDSKLTYLLQDSIGGDSKTVMFATITPSEYNRTETETTLKFARRVCAVELGPAKAYVDVEGAGKPTELIPTVKPGTRLAAKYVKK